MTEPVIIRAYVTHIDCPHCSNAAMGFLSDPRGGTYKCEGCGQDFEVPESAEIDFG